MNKLIKSPTQKPAPRLPRSKGKKSVARRPAPTQIAAKDAKAVVPIRGKLATVIAMLRRPKGASIAELCKATSWQAHSVRGAMSGAIKKKLGLRVTSEKSDGLRTYHIAS